MKDEIKEILNQLEYFNEENYKYYSDFKLNRNQIKQLLDYITNLQEENEKLNMQNDLMEQNIEELQDIRDKAIEYIKELCYIESKKEWFNYGDDLTPKYIVDILQGKEK